MKSPDELTAAIQGRLDRTWHLDVAGAGASWPHTFALGRVASAEIAGNFAEMQRRVGELRRWAARSGLDVRDATRNVGGTAQAVPSHVVVPDLETAAAVAGDDWVQRVTDGRRRAELLVAAHGANDAIPGVLRAFARSSDVDVELLSTAALWFADHDASGLTPRQVPIPGLHAKWLNTNQRHVEALAGKPLGLAPPHPARLHFTYLDPDHLAGGGRRFDVATVGDATALAYPPRVVVISENKDTAVHFPATPGAVAVEGGGSGGSTPAAFEWITTAELVVYWGDIDADGFAILDGYRTAGVPAVSMLMDLATYRRYAPWGTYLRPDGTPVECTDPRPLPTLTDAERTAYLAVCQPADGLPPRLEQERIPLPDAHLALLDLLARPTQNAAETTRVPQR